MKKPIVIVLLTVALVFVLAGIAAVLFFSISNSALNFVNDAFTVSSTSEETRTLEVEAPVLLKVLNEHGDVSVIGADVESITVDVVKTGFGNTQNQADESLKNITYELEKTGETVNLTYRFPGNNRRVDEQVNFVVTVPIETDVDIEASLGEVEVSDIQGSVDVVNKFGNMTVAKVDGPVDLQTSSGKIDVTSVQAGFGDVEVYSGFGTANLEQVRGTNITIESDSGALELENVRATKTMKLLTKFGNIKFKTGAAGTLEVETNSGTITLTFVTVNGELTLKDQFGDIELEQVKAKSYDADTNSGSVTINRAQGNIRAHSGFGNISIENATNATIDLETQSGTVEFSGSLGDGPHTAHSDFGEIELNVPADSELDIDMETKFGKITSDIPITITLTGDITDGQQSGTMNGGGAELKVSTNSGNINIKILK